MGEGTAGAEAASIAEVTTAAEATTAPNPGYVSDSVLGRAGAALRHRDFRLLTIGQALANVGYWALVVALGWLALDLSDSKLVLGLVNACLSIPFLLIALPGGVIADRADRKLLLTVTRCLLVVLMTVLALLTFADVVTVPMLVALAFAAGCTFALDLPARQSLAPELVDPHEVTNAIAVNQMIFTGTTLVGPMLGGLMLATVGAGGAFTLTALGNVALIVMVRKMRFPVRAKRDGSRSMVAELRYGLGYVLHHPVLQGLLSLSAALAILGQPYQSFLPALAKDTLHLGTGSLGVLYTAGGVGSIIGAVLVGVLGDRWRKGPLLLGGTLLFGVLLVGVSRSSVLVVTLPLLMGMGLANAVGGTMTSTIMVTTAPAELRGRVMSVNILVFGLSPFGSLLLGALADLLDVPAALTISGLALLTVITLTAATRPRLRGL